MDASDAQWLAGSRPATMNDATEADIPALLALDGICFPADDETRKPAAPNEIEDAVREGRVRVARVDDEIVGFLQQELPSAHHLYIGALAVHPQFRGRGLAAALLEDLLKADRTEQSRSGRSVSTVTSPQNLEMLGLLLSRGFVVRTMMRDYFGPGQDRFYCQFKSRTEYVDPDDRFIVPVGGGAQWSSLLASEAYHITALVQLPSGPAFEISRFEKDDLGALQAEETSASLAFSGGILASITFLLGLSFTSANFSDAVRILLMGAALATTASLIIYANTSGELARLRTNSFGRYAKWGNVLSEFGGVFPFLVSLPVTFAQVTPSVWAALLTALLFSAALALYDRSVFAISTRFRQSRWTRLLSIAIAAAPVSGAVVIRLLPAWFTWAWTAAVALALTMQSVIYLFHRGDEASLTTGDRRWQIRR
ncbi:GNAT family N-acetyltransferase [Micromonospora sp. NPDC006766]|uniref:GNAT family N-acetyltransferase n=1 Tax=Micromonospora sp. NPDC006766 TaxID=3154778 RepID=UPI0033F8636B